MLITLKKPRFSGISADAIAADAISGKTFSAMSERRAHERKSIAETYLHKDIRIVRLGGDRVICVDDVPGPISDRIEAVGQIRWVGETGEIMIEIDGAKDAADH